MRRSDVAILAQAIPCSSVRTVLLRRDCLCFCLVQLSTSLLLCFPSAPTPLPHVDEATNKPVPVSPVQAHSSNCGSPDGSVPDLDAVGRTFSAPESGRTVDDLFAAISGIQQWTAKIDPNRSTLGNALVVINNRFSELEQQFDLPASRVLAIETGAASASCVSGSPAESSWPLPGMSVPPQLPGPVTQAPQMNAETCGANLKQARMMKTSVAPFSDSFLANNVVQAFPRGLPKKFQDQRKITRFIARVVVNQPHSCLQPEARCSTLRRSTVIKASNFQLTVPFCKGTATIFVRQSKVQESRDIGRRVAPLWKVP